MWRERNKFMPQETRKCHCDAVTCSKCLSGGCKDGNCQVHTKARKEAYKNRTKFCVVPQTEEEIERNRKRIEELRAKGLLEQHEKTFRLLDDGTVIEEKERQKEIREKLDRKSVV